MKQLILAASCCMLLFACAKDENPAQVVEEKGGVTFDIALVNNAEDGFDTRRGLYSQEALQEVENVSIYVFKKDGTDYKYHSSYEVLNWVAGTAQQKFSIPAGSLEDGDYTFVGRGVEGTNSFMITTALVAGTTLLPDFMLQNSSANTVTELFTGTQTAPIVAGEGNQVSLTMTRKVAGVLGYFKNVPSQVGEETVTNLKLTVSHFNNNVSMTADTGSTTVNTPYDLIDMDLTGQATTVDGLYVGNDLSAEGVVKLDNSQLAGRFVVPVKSITMTLGLYNASDVALKTWNVLCEGVEEFDLLANNLYSLGQKVRMDDTDGTPPGEDPEPGDEDTAIDLQLTDDIMITINPNWAAFHELTLE